MAVPTAALLVKRDSAGSIRRVDGGGQCLEQIPHVPHASARASCIARRSREQFPVCIGFGNSDRRSLVGGRETFLTFPPRGFCLLADR